MPLGFIVLGIIAIFALFYLKQQKFIVFVFCLALMASYFIPNINLKSYSINLTLILSLLIAFIYLMFINKNYSFVFYAILVNFIYLTVVKFNSDFLTSLSPVFMFVIVTLFGFMVGGKTKLLHYLITSLLLLTFVNCFLEQPLGFVVIGNIGLLSYFSVSYLICLGVEQLKSKIKLLQRRNVWKKSF